MVCRSNVCRSFVILTRQYANNVVESTSQPDYEFTRVKFEPNSESLFTNRGADRTSSTGTMRTSAKARLINVAIWIQIRIHIRIPDPDLHQNLIICSLPDCQPLLEISCKSVWKFLRKVANKQTDKQGRQP